MGAGATEASGATPDQLRPVEGAGRHDALDVLRGVAVLGIFAMNIAMFAMPLGAYWNPTVHEPFAGVNRSVYILTHTIFDLKMMALFSILFGAGVVLYGRKAEAPAQAGQVRGLWLRRMGWLLALGLIHAYLIWDGDILVTYAVCGLVLLWWVRRLAPGWMLAMAAVFLIIGQLLMLASGWWIAAIFAPGAEERMADWTGGPEAFAKMRADMAETYAPSAEQLEEQIADHRGSYFELLPVRAKSALFMHLYVIPVFLFWRAAGLMLIGAALTRLRVLTGERSAWTYLALAIGGYAIGLPLVILGLVYNIGHGFDVGKLNFLGMQFNGVGSIPMALGHAGLILLLVKLGALGLLGRCLAAAGRMALTNYLAQSVIASLVFYGYGLGLYGTMNRLEQLLVVLGAWAAQLVWSPLWLARYRFGPVEWVWRSLTYWRRQPMRRG